MPLGIEIRNGSGTTQLNSTRRRVELSCVAINGTLNILTVLHLTQESGSEFQLSTTLLLTRKPWYCYRPSVRPLVTLMYAGRIGCVTSKVIRSTPVISLWSSLLGIPTSAISPREHLQISGGI